MDPDRKVFMLLVILAQIAGGLGVILMAVWMGSFQGGFEWGDNDDLKFNYHPMFMTIGLIFIYGDGKFHDVMFTIDF